MINNTRTIAENKFREFVQKTFTDNSVTLKIFSADLARIDYNNGDFTVITYDHKSNQVICDFKKYREI